MTIFASRLRSFFSESKFAGTLQNYFRSGWAFLIPYLAAYLLYAWLKLPVNPVDRGHWAVVPSLLHVYWILHALHFLLGAIALRSWWQSPRDKHGAKSAALGSAPSLHRSPFPVLQTAVPWILLGLLFWIPGIYLEWPSDPWEHLRRINEWQAHSLVTEHSAWRKSSYFLPYSLTGSTSGLTQLSWLNLYYTAMCLLLSWQYYRLARAAGLGERAAMIFVILQALLMGNNVFSFYRYYGLSSSILAQLGAVALTRLAIGAVGGNMMKGEGNTEAAYPRASSSALHFPSEHGAGSLLPSPLSLLLRIASACALVALTAFNHIQGIGIAGLGILAVIFWRLIEWKRMMIAWLVLLAALASVATVWWFPRHPAIIEIYRPQGWLNAWYGFNLFSPASIAFERSFHILGVFGVLNLILALWIIIRRNHVAGWLTLMPVIALSLPCFALPFAHVLATHSRPESIATFHRFLFAVPMGLALMATASRKTRGGARCVAREAGSQDLATGTDPTPTAYFRPFFRTLSRPNGLLLLGAGGLACAVLLSPGARPFNRLWHSLQITADDLQLKHYVAAWTPENLARAAQDTTLTISHPLATKVQEALAPKHDWWRWRQIHGSRDASDIERALGWIRALPSRATSLQPTITPYLKTPRDIAYLTAPDMPWLNRSGGSPVLAASATGLVVSNPTGASTHAFAQELIPLNRGKRYHLTVAIRQSGDAQAINYLAVAWHDKNSRLLVSNEPAPAGAGSPLGWSNGTYSYFGLTGQSAPTSWTTYTISFGLGEQSDIPAHAAFLQAGALLNYYAAPGAYIRLTRLILQEKAPHEHILVILPRAQDQFTSASFAARFSGHWVTSKVPVDHAGTVELRTAISQGAKH